MANGATLAAGDPLRLLIVGEPGTAKTGALVCLMNAGFKLRILDYDHNLAPLWKYGDPAMFKNVDAIQFEDKLRGGQKFAEVAGLPSAWRDGMAAMDRWKYTEGGVEFDLGRSADWGPDTIVVLDSNTRMGESAFRFAMSMMNKTPLNGTQQMWGLAIANQKSFLEKLASYKNRFHVIVIAHLKPIGPKDIMRDDDDVTKGIKTKLADLIETRMFPSALGQGLPREVAGLFPIMLKAETIVKGTHVSRVLRTQPLPELDLKVPAPNLPVTLDIADGLIKVMDACSLGVKASLAWTPSPTTAEKELTP